MALNRSHDQTSIEKHARAWSLRQRGWTLEKIAHEVGIDPGTCCRWLLKIERRELAKLSVRIEAQKVRQAAILEVVTNEAMDAWERSKGTRTRAGRKTTLGVTTEWSEATERDGDPAHLDRAMAALREIRSIWGLNAAIKRPDADDSAGLTYSGLAERLKESAEAHDASTDPPVSDAPVPDYSG